jgi:class 3 adenylate cyclase
MFAKFTGSDDEVLLSESTKIVEQHGGFVSRAEEMELTATFGISPNRVPPQVSALLATHSALSLLEHVRSSHGGSELLEATVRIGIDTGDVTVGLYLPDRKLDQGIRIGEGLTLTGDLVTTAQNLQASAEEWELWISGHTYEYLKPAHHQFVFEPDGMSDGLTAYRVLDRTSALGQGSSEGM